MIGNYSAFRHRKIRGLPNWQLRHWQEGCSFPDVHSPVGWFSGENSAAGRHKGEEGDGPRGILREGGVPES